MPDVILKKSEDNGFFGIQIFTKIGYSTYTDEKRNIKVYAFSEDYDTLLVNLKLVNNMYEINETDQFFGFTFFLNPVKKDLKTVRFVTALEGRAIGIEVPKAYYPTLRKILLKK